MPCNCGKIRACKECQTRYNKAWYRKNRQAQIERCVRRRKKKHDEVRAFLIDQKSKPCTDCGNEYHWFAMDFDHVRGKFMDISLMVSRHFPLDKVKAEIGKCELVCSNCHRLRTWNKLCSSGAVDSAPVS